jgi:hypothetical protein
MSRIIEFSHNGPQLNLSKRSKKNGIAYKFIDNESGIRYWNNEPNHFRKFLLNNGSYLKYLGSDAESGELLFWGEWEPQSKFTITGLNGKLKPNAIHEPFVSFKGIGAHNTDPFVFGADFYYSNCKQKRNHMNRLSEGDMILFGTEYDEGFALDTVFIIKDSKTASEYLKNPSQYPQILCQATLDLADCYQTNPDLRLYQGLMQPKNPKGPFCFFPCKLKPDGPFGRPLLDYKKFNLQSPGARTVLTDIRHDSVATFWLNLVTYLTEKGYYLGIQTDMPPTRDNFSFPVIEKRKGC